MTANTGRIGWIVDAQNDFMLPADRGGRLYVHDLFDDGRDPGAQQIVPALVHTVEWMRANCDVLVYTGDWHAYGDAEIDPQSPDATRGTYPPHCMGLSDDADEREGAQIIPEIRPENPVVLARDATADDAESVVRTAVSEKRPIFIHKKVFSVFEGNAATDPLLHALRDHFGALDVVMIGVARDVCVKGALEGFLERGQPVTLVTDATWGLGLEPEAEALARWMNDGAALITTRGLDLRAAQTPQKG
ncbi:cysteine hydrolase family protein [Longimicrobium terrae]|uniref:nicotinamidase n=1 Tax=Longimicrobium terrae TaxID=1639882 RepID=A0A841GV82_9BACT|nr:isochorismatase family protein [Longimicrobium terrae]MBB4634859.1 nicotinamidase-related amidase [Longimicrobium terrae]MBB6069254.1 nicotinamidase-related amidase [Longimicrobium terrae]NNC31936.1 isochorismatase family protein [Longimicrobium terrae]